MIDTGKLRAKLERIENKHNCSLHFESAKELVEKIQKEYRQGMPREEFVNLVNRWAKKLELRFNYCRVAFSYLSSNRKKEKAQVNNDLQTVFSLENKVFTRAEILK